MWLCIGTAHSKLVIMGSHHVLSLYLKAEIWTLFPPTCAFRGTVATHHHPTEVMYNLSQYVHTVDTDIALTSLICLYSFFFIALLLHMLPHAPTLEQWCIVGCGWRREAKVKTQANQNKAFKKHKQASVKGW